MRDPIPPALAFSSEDPVALAREIFASGIAGSGRPSSVSVDGEEWKGATDFESIANAAPERASIYWTPAQGLLSFKRGGLVRVGLPDTRIDMATFRDSLQGLSFKWMSAGSISSVWGPGGQPHEYDAPSFGDGHYEHGWVCAFRGSGNSQLVSRRWLDYGPWRVIRGDGDLTAVQFHDLDAEDLEALAQAEPAHQRMGISDEGGFIPPRPATWRYPALRNLYDPKSRQLTVVVHGRSVSQAEMLEACALRLYQPMEVPVDNVAFVFMTEEPARQHLHELWLRGLECRAIIQGQEVRLDADYSPAPAVPEWVTRVRAREGF